MKKLGQVIIFLNLFLVLPALGGYTGDNLLGLFLSMGAILAFTTFLGYKCDMFDNTVEEEETDIEIQQDR